MPLGSGALCSPAKSELHAAFRGGQWLLGRARWRRRPTSSRAILLRGTSTCRGAAAVLGLLLRILIIFGSLEGEKRRGDLGGRSPVGRGPYRSAWQGTARLFSSTLHTYDT